MIEETKLYRHQDNVYKVRLVCSGDSACRNVTLTTVEPAIRAVLYAEERGITLSKLDTNNFQISYSKKVWKASEKLGFAQNGKLLEPYPYLLVFSVEAKRNDSDTNNNCDIASNVSRNLDPVVILDRLNVPVSKKPDKTFQENQSRTSPRRRRYSLQDNLSMSRKRDRNSIDDENLPFCGKAKVPKTTSSGDARVDINVHEKSKHMSRKNASDSPRSSRSSKKRAKTHTPRRNAMSSQESSPMSTRSMRSESGSRNSRLGRKHLSRTQSPSGKNKMSSRELERQVLESPGPSSPLREKRKRTRSGFWQFVETLMTPVKMFTRRK